MTGQRAQAGSWLRHRPLFWFTVVMAICAASVPALTYFASDRLREVCGWSAMTAMLALMAASLQGGSGRRPFRAGMALGARAACGVSLTFYVWSVVDHLYGTKSIPIALGPWALGSVVLLPLASVGVAGLVIEEKRQGSLCRR